MFKPFPPDDDLGPEMTPLEAYSRAMRLNCRSIGVISAVRIVCKSCEIVHGCSETTRSSKKG